MMFGILLLLVVLGYANAVDDHGSSKVVQFWGDRPTAREQLLREDYIITPQTIQRFGYQFGPK